MYKAISIIASLLLLLSVTGVNAADIFGFHGSIPSGSSSNELTKIEKTVKSPITGKPLNVHEISYLGTVIAVHIDVFSYAYVEEKNLSDDKKYAAQEAHNKNVTNIFNLYRTRLIGKYGKPTQVYDERNNLVNEEGIETKLFGITEIYEWSGTNVKSDGFDTIALHKYESGWDSFKDNVSYLATTKVYKDLPNEQKNKVLSDI